MTLFRTALYRDQRGAHGARNAAAWLAVMTATLALTWNLRSGWAVVGSWGSARPPAPPWACHYASLAGAAGSGLALVARACLAARPLAWGESVLWAAHAQVTTLLAGVLGVAELGGCARPSRCLPS